MESIYIHTTASYMKQIIQKDSVTEMTQKKPSMNFLKNSTIIFEWGKKICIYLSNRKISPKDYDTQKFIIRNHFPYGYEAIYYLIRANHPNNLNHPIDIISETPTKSMVRYTLSKY